jgi:hypothetical protein
MSRWLLSLLSTSATVQRQQVMPLQALSQAGQVLPLEPSIAILLPFLPATEML